MPWKDVADLPYAAALTAHQGGLAADEDYDTVHFDAIAFDDPDASGSRFLECALTQVSVQAGEFRRARFADVWMRDVRLVGTGLAESGWLDVTVAGGAAAGVDAGGAQLRRVLFTGCKLEAVSFRFAQLTEVTFENCVLRDSDFTGAVMTKTAFPQSKLSDCDFTKVTMDQVDLRGAELGIKVDPGSLRGAIVTTGQLATMAALLADSIGIIVCDE